ncbi:unnamed protein product, partial [Durusdinium trenchii]
GGEGRGGGKARHQEKQGELPGNWNSVSSADSLQLNSRGKPGTVRCVTRGQAQLPDSFSQAGSSDIMSRRGVSTSQNADTPLGPDPDEEARHSDAFANRSPSPTGNTKQDLQTPPSLATEAQSHRMTRVAFRRKKHAWLMSDGVSAFDKKYENQLERFLGALVQADHRLIGAHAGHRIQIVDCSLGLEGELGVDGFMKEVYGRLDTVLSQRDSWETRFRELEAFAEKNGKLPRRLAAGCDRAETVLGNWLITQARRLRLQQMPAHQLQRLLNARSDHIRRRAEGWMAGGRVGRFKQNCRELKEYIETNGKLPTRTRTKRNWRNSSSNRLANWFKGVQDRRSYNDMPERRKMLGEVHPLVKERLQEWDDSPVQVDLARWEKQLEKVLHIVKHGRLPKRMLENAEYKWLWVQLRRLDALPPELAKRLRGSHPLIAAEAARTSGGVDVCESYCIQSVRKAFFFVGGLRL